MALLGMNKQRAFGQLPPQMSPLQAYGDGSTPAMMQQPMQPQQQPEQPAKFKPNWLGVLGDAMQVFGGGQATYMQGVREQQERTDQMRQRALEQQQQRETGWQDYVRKQEYERANPKAAAEDQLTRYMRGAGIDPMSDKGKAMYSAAATNEAYPERAVQYTDEQGNSGLRFIRSGMPPQAPPEFAGWGDEEGGQTQPVSGNFRR